MTTVGVKGLILAHVLVHTRNQTYDAECEENRHKYRYTVHTCLYGVINAGPSSSMIGGREGISLIGSGSTMSRLSSPNHLRHCNKPHDTDGTCTDADGKPVPYINMI